MAVVLLRRQTSQPTEQPAVNRGHPLAQGLASCFVLNQGVGVPLDLVRTRVGSAPSWRQRPLGYSAYGNVNVADLASSVDLNWTSGPFTVACLFHINVVAGASQFPVMTGRYAYTNETANRGWILQARQNSGAYSFIAARDNATSDGTGGLDTITTQTTGTHLIVGTSDGTTTRSIYLDGRFEASSTTSNKTPLSNTTGAGLAVGQTTPEWSIYAVYVWFRALTSGDVRDLWVNPWVFLQPPRQRLFARPGGAQSVTAAETHTVSEAVARSTLAGRTTAETETVSESAARVVVLARPAAEASTIAETVARSTKANRALGETSTIAEAVSSTQSGSGGVSETFTITESVARRLLAARTAAETNTILDTVARTAAVSRTLAEPTTIAEVVARAIVDGRAAAEPVTIVDTLTGQRTIARSVAEAVTVAETVARRVAVTRGVAEVIIVVETVAGVAVGVTAKAVSTGGERAATSSTGGERTVTVSAVGGVRLLIVSTGGDR